MWIRQRREKCIENEKKNIKNRQEKVWPKKGEIKRSDEIKKRAGCKYVNSKWKVRSQEIH